MVVKEGRYLIDSPGKTGLLRVLVAKSRLLEARFLRLIARWAGLGFIRVYVHTLATLVLRDAKSATRSYNHQN
jgi:hypothetical protein